MAMAYLLLLKFVAMAMTYLLLCFNAYIYILLLKMDVMEPFQLQEINMFLFNDQYI